MELLLKIMAHSEIPVEIHARAWRDQIQLIQGELAVANGAGSYAEIIYRKFPGGESLAILHGPNGRAGIDFGTGPVWGALSSDQILTVDIPGDAGGRRQYDIRDGSRVESARYLG